MELVQFPSLPFFITLFLFFSFFLLKRRSSVKPRGPPLPPGPWKLPFIGSLHHLARRGFTHHTLRDLARVHGPLLLLRLGQVVVVSSREAAEEVMKHHDVNSANRPEMGFPKIIAYNGTDIVMSPCGGHWKQLKKICAMELFSINRVKSSFSSAREEVVLNLMKDVGSTPDQTALYLLASPQIPLPEVIRHPFDFFWIK